MIDIKDTSLEVPSLKRYGLSSYDESKINMTASDYLFKYGKGKEDDIALSFMGNTITYGEFKEKKDYVAKALQALGLQRGDRVAVLSSNTPETAFVEYGANVLGVVPDFIDPRVKSETLLEMLKNEKVKAVIVLDLLAYPILNTIIHRIEEETEIKSIVTLPALMSAPKPIKKLMEIKAKLSRKETLTSSEIEFIKFEHLLEDSRYENLYRAGYAPNETAIITHTSGSTTGIPKPVEITNENINSVAYSHDLAGFSKFAGKKLLHILPYFAAYGSACATQIGFSLGMELQDIAKFDVSKVGRLIAKYRSNIVFATPSWLIAMTKDPALKNADLSCIDIILVGGDSMSIEDEIMVNNWLKAHNCKAKVTKGYGLSESSGCGLYTVNDQYNLLGSVGITLPLTNIAIVDPVSKELLKFDGKEKIEGESLIEGPGITPKLDESRYMEINGKTYLLTGDLMSMDREGNFRHIERMDRTFTRYDGYKFHPGDVEKKVRNYNIASSCAIVPYQNEEKSGKMPAAFVVVNDMPEKSREDVVKELIDTMIADKTLTTRDIPSRWVFVDELPLNLMSKVDFRVLEETIDTYDAVEVSFVESNIDFSYRILPSKKSKNTGSLRMLLKK